MEISNGNVVMEEVDNLKTIKNSRWRVESNVDELMESIKQQGLLQPIAARKEDKVVICGNRRLYAFKKLGYTKIPVIFKTGVTDKELLILNITENIQRKDISSVEVGALVFELMNGSEFNMTIGEISVKLGINQNRVKVCLQAYKSLPEKFRKDVVHLNAGANKLVGTLPENVVASILTLCSANSGNHVKLNDAELETILNFARTEGLTVAQVRLFGILVGRGMTIKKALNELDKYRVIRADVIVVKEALFDAMQKEQVTGTLAFINKICKSKYPALFL